VFTGEGPEIHCSTPRRYWNYDRRGSRCCKNCSEKLKYFRVFNYSSLSDGLLRNLHGTLPSLSQKISGCSPGKEAALL
jgi:hypothetical protein